MPAQPVRPHIHEPQGGADMETKRIQHGNSVVIIHSPNGLISMSTEQQRAWFECEWKAGNPAIRSLADAMIRFESSREVKK